MKFTINKGCFGTTITIVDEDKTLSKEANLRELLGKLIEQLDESDLERAIEDYACLIKPTVYEDHTCGQCGDWNYYGEYEIK